jgi:hypothetical protein
MYINAISHYLPSTIVGNGHYTRLNGLSDDWIFRRSGIRQRTRAADGENTNTKAIDAITPLIGKLPYRIEDVDLIVGATYTPYDTWAPLPMPYRATSAYRGHGRDDHLGVLVLRERRRDRRRVFCHGKGNKGSRHRFGAQSRLHK